MAGPAGLGDRRGVTRTVSFPPPSVHVCPDCEGPVAHRRCSSCGLGLDGPDAGTLWWIDGELHRLSVRRAALLHRLRQADRASAAVPPRAFPHPPPPPPAGATAHTGAEVQNLLLGLGALCLAVAAAVFAAVTWDRLGALAQGGLLLGLTGVLATLAAAGERRGLRATAEAVSAAALALAVVDIHAVRVGAVPDLDPVVVWAAGVATVAMAAAGFSRLAPLVVPRVGAVLAAQVPALLLATALAPTGEWVLAVALVQSAVVLGCLRLGRGRPIDPWVVTVAAVGATATWVVASAGALAVALGGEAGGDAGADAVVLFTIAAAVAAGVALAWADLDAVRLPSLAAATVTGAAAIICAFDPFVAGDAQWLAWGALGVAVVAVTRFVPARWGNPPAAVGAILALGACGPGLPAVIEAVLGPLNLTADPWQGRLADPARATVLSLGEPAWRGDTATAGYLLVGWALLLAAGRRIGTGLAPAAVAALSVVSLAVFPLVVDASAGVALAAVLLGALGAAAVAVISRPTRWVAWPSTLLLASLAVVWGLVSEAGTITALAVVTAAAAAVAAYTGSGVDRAHPGRPDGSGDPSDLSSATGAVAVATVAGGSLAVVLPLAFGTEVATAWLCLVVSAALVSPVGWLVERSGRPGLAGVLDVALVVPMAVAGSVLAATGDIDRLSLALLVGVAAFAAHALRPTRRPSLWVAVAAALVLVWLRLAVADVAAVEAYTLPAAVALLAAGWAYRRSGASTGSWATVGHALVVAFGPTLVVSLDDPGLVRPLVTVVAATAVLLGGVRARAQAPVAVGAAVVAVLAARQLAPLAADLPRYVVFATVGAVLLALGATFEQRRRDVSELRDRFGRLH